MILLPKSSGALALHYYRIVTEHVFNVVLRNSAYYCCEVQISVTFFCIVITLD